MNTQRKIAVAGATGRVGRHVVDVLGARGYDVVPMSRSSGVDLVSGSGLEEALVGVDCIVDAATGGSPDEQAATAFFTAAARNLQALGERAGVTRIVVVSIIGIDRFSAGYSAAKVAHERALLSGRIPVRILRASQFHEFVPQLVAARTVAEALADLANGSAPAPRWTGLPILEIAGPREESLVETATLLAARRGDPVRIEGVTNPDDPDAHLYEAGGLLPGPGAILAGPTFEEWLGSEG